MRKINQRIVGIFILFLMTSVLYYLYFDKIVTSKLSDITLVNLVLSIKFWIFLFITVLFMVVIHFIVHKKYLKQVYRWEDSVDRLNMFNRTPAIVFTTDSSGKITQVSDYFIEFTGYPREEIIGRISTDFLSDESKKYWTEVIVPSYYLNGYISNAPCRAVKKDGKVLDILLSTIAEKSESGEILRNHNVVTDVTKLKEVENDLFESKDFYQKIIYAIPDVFIETDLKGSIIFVNDIGLEIMAKYSTYDILGRNIISLLAPQEVERASLNFRLMFEKPLGVIEYNLIMNDSTELICEVNGQVLLRSDNQPYGMIFIIRDITQRKKLEKELKRKEAKYRSFIETSKNIIWETAKDGTITYLNPISAEILGYPIQELYGKPIIELAIPEQIPDLINRYNEDQKKGKKIRFFEVTTIHGVTKQKQYLEINSNPIFSDDNTIVGFRGIAHNITERKRNELLIKEAKEKLEVVMREGQIGFWSVDFSIDSTYINHTLASTLGYTVKELENLKADRYVDYFHPDDLPDIQLFFQAVMSGSKPNFSREHRMIHKNGEVKWLLSVGKVEKYDVNGKPVEVIGISKDITERKTAELKLIEANATKDKLFSIIAHDLKNPFNTILGFSELLKMNLSKYSSEKVEEMVCHINSSANSLYILLDNLLQWANSQRGKTQFNPISLNLGKVVMEENEYISYFAKEKGVIINPYNINVNLTADYDLLKIIIRNLLTNAVKYSKPGDKIEVYSETFPDRVEVSISDQGIGMSEDIKCRIFSLDKAKSQKGTANEHGTGLGLMLCKEYVEMHNGRIWVESTVGVGSCFTFSLPIS